MRCSAWWSYGASNTFDPIAYKETTRQQWQAAAKAWNEWAPLLRTWLGPATATMLDMARIGTGDHVLDVAAGAGDQTPQVAERVGPTGHVLATDISSSILAYAAENARQAGHRNVDIKVLDGERLDVAEATFDAVISRVGLIYFPDQQRALAGMKRALAPGGRVAAIVYGPPETTHSLPCQSRSSGVAPTSPHHSPANPGRSASAAQACWTRPCVRQASGTSRAG